MGREFEDQTPAAEPACDGFYTAHDAKNQRRIYVWLLPAMLAYLGATAAARWPDAVPVALRCLLIGSSLLFAIQTTRSYLVFLKDADELLRRIETQALALGFAAGVGLSLLYPQFESLGAPKLDGQVTAVVMMLAAAAGSWLDRRRYAVRGGA